MASSSDAGAALAALAEHGLPLVERPFDAWARALGQRTDELLDTLTRWLAQGTLSRFGMVAYASSLDQGGPIAQTAEAPPGAPGGLFQLRRAGTAKFFYDLPWHISH